MLKEAEKYVSQLQSQKRILAFSLLIGVTGYAGKVAFSLIKYQNYSAVLGHLDYLNRPGWEVLYWLHLLCSFHQIFCCLNCSRLKRVLNEVHREEIFIGCCLVEKQTVLNSIFLVKPGKESSPFCFSLLKKEGTAEVYSGLTCWSKYS